LYVFFIVVVTQQVLNFILLKHITKQDVKENSEDV